MDNESPKDRLRLVAQAEPEDALVLTCTFRDIEGFLTYTVPASEWDRVQRVLDDDDKAFLGIDTLDGREVFLNLSHLQTCRMSIRPWTPTRSELDNLNCHLLGSDIVEMPDIDREWVPNIAQSLEEYGNLGERFVQFPDELGGHWAINMADIVFIEFPLAWHNEASDAQEEELAEAKPKAKRRARKANQKPRR